MAQEWLKDLNPKQKEAVLFGQGPLLVVAGAGSGKTRTLAYRVAHLISSGVSPEKILLLTFTRRAAKEMLNRAAEALGSNASLTSSVWGGTFHATANRLLRIYNQAAGIGADFTILDQSDAQDLLDVIRHKKIEGTKKGRFPRKGTLLAIYSRRMNSGESLDDIIKNHFPWCERWKSTLKEIFKEYVFLKQKRNTLDYDDLLLYWYHILDDPTVARSIEKRFDYILVDEYQDTNQLQSRILLKMRRNNKNIMAVGDDAQSIYGFRAATVRNMLDFPTTFNGAHVITLEHNYRSTEAILRTTNLLIAQAKERYTKNLYSNRDGTEKPLIITCKDEEGEADTVIEKILEHYEQGVALQQQAVLFRAGSHSAALELGLMKKDIPFHKFGGLKFLEAAHIKDFIAFIRIIENRKDETAWFRVLQLFEGIGPSTASAIYERVAGHDFDLEALKTVPANKTVKQNLSRLYQLLASVQPHTEKLPVQLDQIARFYKPLLEDNYENAKVRCNDIEHIVGLSGGYSSRTKFLSDLILDPPSSTSDLAKGSKKDEDSLVLSTIHSAKGCEWDVVYLIHAADGCLPSDMATESDEAIEEELRLTYVAMTRARNHLYVTWPLRFYSRPGGFSDRHVYSQCSRFFSKDIIESMKKISHDEKHTEEQQCDIAQTVDIKDRLRSMWE
ncbi:ATP-dependent helicase [Chitinispirillales bacterium ANBcel5]|uniref:ATP-dependent helicase n=1 Tax=Cellulosispirillum alkaliphilum TaxID=3039283 RepID=UPI002A5647E9|nr:ATP-dependent helicase [Chitinispirillales bacterium ANBcel5]